MGIIYMSAEKPKRGPANSDRQLSRLQRRILLWLYEFEKDVELWREFDGLVRANGRGKAEKDDGKRLGRCFQAVRNVDGWMDRVKVYAQRGAPWSAKVFFDDAPTRSQEQSLSRALRRLEVRGLVSRYDAAASMGAKPRTTHLKLTKAGVKLANFEHEHGMTQRQALEQRRKELGRRELWALRKKYRQAQEEHKNATAIFEQEGGVLFSPWDPGHDGSGTIFQDRYEQEHKAYMQDLARDIATLEVSLGEGSWPLAEPEVWLAASDILERELECLECLEEMRATEVGLIEECCTRLAEGPLHEMLTVML